MSDTIRQELEIVDKFSQPLRTYTDGVRKGGEESEKAEPKVKKLGQGMEKITGAVKGFVAAWVSVQGLNLAKELAEGAVQAEATGRAFATMSRKAGVAADDMMMRMRDVTRQMVDDTTLQQRSMDALLASVAPEDILTAMEFATQRALALGRDVSGEMDTILKELMKNSVGAINDMGITAKTTAEALVQMREALDLSTGANGGPLESIKQYQANILNIKDTIGNQLVPGLERWYELQSNTLSLVNETLSKYQDIVRYMTAEITGGMSVWQLEEEAVNEVINHRLELMKAEEALQSLNGTMAWHRQRDARKEVEAIREQGRLLQAKHFWNQEEEITLEDIVALRNRGNAAITAATREMLAQRAATQETLKIEESRVVAAEALARAEERGGEWEADFRDRMKFEAEGRAQHLRWLDEQQAIQDEIVAGDIHDQEELWQATLSRIEREKLAEQELATIREQNLLSMQNSAISIAGSLNSLSQSRIANTQAEYDADIKRIEGSRMSEKRKAREIEKIEQKKKEMETEAAKRNLAYAATMAAVSVAQSTANAFEAFTSTMAGQRGGVLIKTAAAMSVLASALGGVAQVKAAAGQIPKREHGGVMIAGRPYEVGEGGKMEMFSSGRGSIMVPPASGVMTPNVTTNNGSTYNVSVNVQGNGNTEEIKMAVRDALYDLDSTRQIDYGRMPNLRRAVS